MVTFDPPTGSGGIEGRAMAYTKNFLKRGKYIEVAAFAPGGDAPPEQYFGTKLHRISSSFGTLPRGLSGLVGVSVSSSLDAEFFLSGGSTPIGVLGLCFARLTGRRSGVFFYGRDLLHSRKSLGGKLLLSLSVLLAHGVGTNSVYTAGLLPRGPRRRAVVAYPGVDPQLAIAAEKATGDKEQLRVLFVGRLVRRKGCDLLLRAFCQIKASLPGALLDLVGDGPEMKGLVALSEELGVRDAVTFHGALYGEQLWNRYACASLFVMPTRESGDDVEGFGTVYLEAGAFGVPSIATRTGGVPEAVLDGVTGRLVKSEDADGLAIAMLELLRSPEERRRLGDGAKARAARFTWQASTEQVLRIMGEESR